MMNGSVADERGRRVVLPAPLTVVLLAALTTGLTAAHAHDVAHSDAFAPAVFENSSEEGVEAFDVELGAEDESEDRHENRDEDRDEAGLDGAIEHVRVDVAPTLAEEAELLRRAEAEGIGVNPATEAARQIAREAAQSAGRQVAPQAARQATSESATYPGLTKRAADRAFNLAVDPALTGRWEPLMNWPVIPVFASLLPDGRVLTFDSVGDSPTESYATHSYTRASVWDPVTDTHSRLDSDTGYNLFCAGFATLEDGRLFIAGGNADAALNGIDQTHTFNPLSDTWARGQRMDFARWYPAVTPLANGEMLITGGGFPVSEVREKDGRIRRLGGATSSLWDNREYPWLQTAPDGRVAFLGPARQLGFVDTEGAGAFQATQWREQSRRSYGSYAMYDIGKVMVSGGGFQSDVTDQRATNLIDLNTSAVTASGVMNNRRRQHDLTVLADGSVLATGGYASNEGLVDLQNSVFEAELWRPETGAWQRLAEEDRARHYHSVALLLPDGRVLSGGGGICGTCQQVGYIQKNAQVFTPPYLFARDGSGALAPRPAYSAAPAAVGYRQSFSVSTAQAARIRKVALIRTGAVTHSQNMEQRHVPLDFSIRGNTLSIQSPTNANIAPPGHYLLFIIDDAGVPSVAEIVSVRESLSDPSPAIGVVNVALTGTARQSSTAAAGGIASVAIDGNTDGRFANGSVTRTLNTRQSWWEVDLGEVQAIRQIVINRRSDCCTDRLSNFHVLVSDVPFDNGLLSNALARPGVSDFFVADGAAEKRIDVGRSGRYVRVQLAGSANLELAEVQVLVEGDTQSGTCGSPGVDPASEGGLHLWKDCDGPWNLMLSGEPGTGTVTAAGALSANVGFISVTPASLESSDTLSNTDPVRIDFDLRTSNPWSDRFEFTTLADDQLCIAIDSSVNGQSLFIGPDRIPAGNGPINPETLQSCVLGGSECTEPLFDPRADRALLTWIDCDGVLRMIGSGGLEYARYTGKVHADARFTDTATRSFESSDTLARTSDSEIFFDMGMGGGYADELLLSMAGDAELCVEISGQSGNTRLLAGADRAPVTSPFDPRTLAPCVPPTSSVDCGDPQVDTREDSALFVWMNCDGSWSVVLTGMQADGSTVNVQGSVTSSAGLGTLTPRGLENSDSAASSASGTVSFDMTTINPWSDGFDFEAPANSSLCVTLGNVSGGLDVLAGPDRTPVGTAFNPVTYAAC